MDTNSHKNTPTPPIAGNFGGDSHASYKPAMTNDDAGLPDDIDTIRQQMDILREKLQTQEIINGRMMVAAMKRNMSWIRRYIIFEVCLLPLLAILWYGLKVYVGLSWFNYVFLILMLCVDIYADYRINLHSMSDADYQRNNLIETMRKLSLMKRRRALQMAITMPVLVLWLLWTGVEAWMSLSSAADDSFRYGFIQGGLLGGVIGGIVGIVVAFRIYHKMQRTNDEVITTINSMTAGYQ
ncbi:MAG: hypothetical protein ACI3Y5_04570 [Prevotella sp.]